MRKCLGPCGGEHGDGQWICVPCYVIYDTCCPRTSRLVDEALAVPDASTFFTSLTQAQREALVACTRLCGAKHDKEAIRALYALFKYEVRT